MTDIHEQTAALLQQLQNIGNQNAALPDPRKKPTYKPYVRALNTVPTAVTDTPIVEPTVPDEAEVTELQEQLPSIQDTPSLPYLTDSPVGFEIWETLAYDLALAHTDRNTIAHSYGITPAQLDHLETNVYFSKMLAVKKEEVRSLGSDAAFTIKMRMVANRALPQFLKRLTDSSTNNKDFHALFKTAVELAQLLPQPTTGNTQTQAVIGASVTFNIQGVPGLEHLATTATTLSDDKDTIDAAFTEIIEHQSKHDDELMGL